MSDARRDNFSAGPAGLPDEVVREAQRDLWCLPGAGAGVCELSHRGPEYTAIHEDAEAGVRRLLGLDDDWAVLFLQGGASAQFAWVPLNLGPGGDYVLSGVWSEKALAEAQLVGPARAAGSSADTRFDRLPTPDLDPAASYVHVTSNNTIYGTQWPEVPRTDAPLVCDASSDILARPLDLTRYALIYAGAQHTLGPAGTTLVLIRDTLLARETPNLPRILRYATHAEAGSRFHTPPTFGVYLIGRMCAWLERRGGLEAQAERNRAKADRLYATLDAHDLYRPHAQTDARSTMNVTWRLADPDLEPMLLDRAAAQGTLGLKGHRSVGGLRASLYNAVELPAVERLADLLDAFAREHRSA